MRVALHLLSVGFCRHCERVTRAGGSWTPVSFPSICGLILHPAQGPVLFDTGYSSHFEVATRSFPERLYRWLTPVHLDHEQLLTTQLASHGLRPSDIRWCLISHFHADHIAGLKDLTHARFICLQEDFAQLRGLSRVAGLRHGLLPALLPGDFESRLRFANDLPRRQLPGAWAGLAQGYDLLGDDSLLALPLPGHVPGQMGVLLHDAQDREVLLCADACWSLPALQAGQLPMGVTRLIMHQWLQYQRTFALLRDLTQRHPELVVLPSHCQASLKHYRGDAEPAC